MTAGGVIGITGRPSSGKSTMGARVVQLLLDRGVRTAILDGDDLRAALVPSPGYTEPERDAFYETLARVAGLLARQGVWVVVPATAPLRRHRDALRRAAARYVEVLVDATVEECESRDPKGLYARFRNGLAPDLPGVGAPFEPPTTPDVVARGGEDEHAARAAAGLARTEDGTPS